MPNNQAHTPQTLNAEGLLIRLDLPIAHKDSLAQLVGKQQAPTRTHRVFALLEHKTLKSPVKNKKQLLSQLDGERIKLTLADGFKTSITRTLPVGMLPAGYQPTLWADTKKFEQEYQAELTDLAQAGLGGEGALSRVRLAVWMREGYSIEQAVMRNTLLHTEIVKWDKQVREEARNATLSNLIKHRDKQQEHNYSYQSTYNDGVTAPTLH